MSVYTPPSTFTYLRYGERVNKTAATLPASTLQPLFTVTGGRIILTRIFGEVTTVIQTQANAAKLVSTPTAGTAVDLCVAADITAREVGARLAITGVAGASLVIGNAGAVAIQAVELIIPAGSIGFHCAATNTGATKWSMWYIPIDDGATVVSA